MRSEKIGMGRWAVYQDEAYKRDGMSIWGKDFVIL